MPAAAQEPDATTREAAIEQEQAEKVPTLHPYVPGKGEELANKAEDILANGGLQLAPVLRQRVLRRRLHARRRLHEPRQPVQHCSMCAAATRSPGYKRVEAEFIAPRLFHRRGALSVLGGWREATQVGFYGLGMDTLDRRPHELRFQAAVRVGDS